MRAAGVDWLPVLAGKGRLDRVAAKLANQSQGAQVPAGDAPLWRWALRPAERGRATKSRAESGAAPSPRPLDSASARPADPPIVGCGGGGGGDRKQARLRERRDYPERANLRNTLVTPLLHWFVAHRRSIRMATSSVCSPSGPALYPRLLWSRWLRQQGLHRELTRAVAFVGAGFASPSILLPLALSLPRGHFRTVWRPMRWHLRPEGRLLHR